MSSTAGLLAVFHVWSTKKNLQPHVAQHPGVHIYHDKTSGSTTYDPYSYKKRKYVEGKGIPWYLGNKRPERIRDCLNELEDMLESQYIACISWRDTRSFQFVLSNAALISITIAADSPDIEKIFIDKSFVGKLPDYIFDGVIEEQFLIFSFLEKSRLMIVNFSKRTTAERKDVEKISSYEPKLSVVDVPGPSGKRVKRHITCNIRADLVCVWWKSSGEEAWPWSPLVSDADRANIVLLQVTGISSVYTIDVLTFMRTDGDLLDVIFSCAIPNQLLTIEQSQSSSAKYLLDACVYEQTGNKITKISVTTIPIKKRVICQSRNPNQNKIILVSSSGSMVLWDQYQRKSKTVKPSFIPNQISWHSGGLIFLISNLKGDMQIFDIALNCLCIQLISETFPTSEYLRLSPYFFTPPKLKIVSWASDTGIAPTPEPLCCCDDILLVFERGPICVLRLQLGVCTQGLISPVELTCEYIKHEQINEAVLLLNSLNWNTNGKTCFQCLVLITDHVFRQTFNANHEACIEDALGSFYAPIRTLDERTILMYRDDISRLARRFFHHLLRHERFEKAFLLAVDIGSKDLFMDIHYLAQDAGNLDLADASKERALQIHHSETKDGLGDIPSDYLSDDVNDEHILQIDKQLHQIDINQNLRLAEQTLQRRSRRKHQTQELQRYEFDESEDENTEDPVAWALASRAGQLQRSQEEASSFQEKSKKSEDLRLVHFGNV